jgi:protein TonB
MGKSEGQYTQARTSDAPKPKYPDTARRDGKEGRVLLRVLVNEEGRTASVQVNRSSGVESLDQAALEAIKRWRFSPARLGDRPVESWVRIPIDFRLTDARD